MKNTGFSQIRCKGTHFSVFAHNFSTKPSKKYTIIDINQEGYQFNCLKTYKRQRIRGFSHLS